MTKVYVPLTIASVASECKAGTPDYRMMCKRFASAISIMTRTSVYGLFLCIASVINVKKGKFVHSRESIIHCDPNNEI
jgi:hypothetical protein